MKKTIIDLAKEHGSILIMLKIMNKVSERLKEGLEVDKEHLREIVEFLRNFADKCHHGKEEEILFPELLKNDSDKALVNELLGEHKTGRDFIRGINESLENCQPGNPDSIHIAINAIDYIALLTEHIRKESLSLFPMAEKLPEEIHAEMEKKFEKLEKDVMGTGKYEEYQNWLKKLQEIYPA
jgi:hemerythrin-like domain-containing protein